MPRMKATNYYKGGGAKTKKRKKKKLVKYQGTKTSIVNRASDMLKTIMSNVPRPTIPGTMGNTGVPMPLGSKDKSNPKKLKLPKPKVEGITGTTNIPMPLKYGHGGSCGPTQWTRNGKGSRRAL